VRTSIRRVFAIAASVVALTAPSATVAAASPADKTVQPAGLKNCTYGQDLVLGGSAWGHCDGDSTTDKFRVRVWCRATDGRTMQRYGEWLGGPTQAKSIAKCLATEFPYYPEIEPWEYNPRPPWRFCPRTELPVPAGTEDGYIQAADPSGRYQVGYSVDTNEDFHELLWDNGVLTDVDSGSGFSRPFDVNASGAIMYSNKLYHDGEIVRLRTRAPYTTARADAINGAGQVAGRLENNSTAESVPVIWSPDNQVTVLPVPDDTAVGAPVQDVVVEDIDEDGTVLGNVAYNAGTREDKYVPIVWYRDGTWRLLHGPLGDKVDTYAVSIRNGRILGQHGEVAQEDGWKLIVEWDTETGTAALMPVLGIPEAINADGDIQGYLSGSWGEGFLPAGTSDPRPTQVKYGYPSHLTDTDVAYGSDLRATGGPYIPAKWDCRG
jgi:hypothetical protein